MPPHYDSVYLSPHLDDAALSCGGQIFRQTQSGLSVLAVTIMAGDPPSPSLSPFADSLHGRWKLEAEAVAVRRSEDAAAFAILGADTLHWDIPDSIYRQHPETGDALYASESAIFGEINPVESALVNTLVDLMGALPAFGRLFVPLTIGHHVDHQLVRRAAEKTFDPASCMYYEDYPYVQNEPALAWMTRRETMMRSELIPLSPAALDAKVRAIACYTSQLEILFGGFDDMTRQVEGYVQRLQGERVWRRI